VTSSHNFKLWAPIATENDRKYAPFSLCICGDENSLCQILTQHLICDGNWGLPKPYIKSYVIFSIGTSPNLFQTSPHKFSCCEVFMQLTLV